MIPKPSIFKNGLAQNAEFRNWLSRERREAIANLTRQTEPVGMFRAQGRLMLLDELEDAVK